VATPGIAPLLSIIVPTYNRAALVPAAASSALAQTIQDLEVIIVDDGSTDATSEVSRELARRDKRVRPVSVSHRGLGAARNAGLAVARGAWAAFLDDDDLLDPEFADAMLRFAGNDHPACACEALAFAAPTTELVSFHDLQTNGVERYAIAQLHTAETFDRITLPLLVLASRFPVNAILVRTDLVRQLGGFREGFEPCEDYDLWLRLLEREGSIPVLHRQMALVRQHPCQMSHDLGAMARATIVTLTRTLERGPELRRTVGRGRLHARMGTLHREIAYSALLRRQRKLAVLAAFQAIRFNPADMRAWAYALLAPFPDLHKLAHTCFGHTGGAHRGRGPSYHAGC
jgi:glycosyltransferase involved in cell wall biosynthesis